MTVATAGIENLVQGLDEAVIDGSVESITTRVKGVLQGLTQQGGLRLPESMVEPLDDRYARRLLHRAADGRYSVIVMTWGADQGTPLHDHAGLWCVECVHEGEIDVVQYDLREQDGDRYRFQPEGSVRAGVGSAGCLIPPFEYHTICNASKSERAVTIHVYGGDLDECTVFNPEGGAWYQRQVKQLSCDN